MGFLPGLLSIGFRASGFRGRFRGHVGLSFFGFAAAGRGRGCGEVGDRSDFRQTTFVRQRAPAGFRSVAYLGPPYRAFGVWRQSARYRVARGGLVADCTEVQERCRTGWNVEMRSPGARPPEFQR